MASKKRELKIDPFLENLVKTWTNRQGIVKRPPTAFKIFCKYNREKISKENPRSDNSIISVLLLNNWKNAPNRTKKLFHKYEWMFPKLLEKYFPGYHYIPIQARKKTPKLHSCKEAERKARSKTNEDEILVSESKRSQGNIEITNDGATILRSIGADNPAAKILVEISKVQDSEVGDGTTTVAVLASELLKEADKLLAMKLHPQTIIAGWRKAMEQAKCALQAHVVDRSSSPEQFEKDLLNIARATLSSKILNRYKDFFANIALSAVKRLNGSTNLKAIQFIKKLGGCLTDSFLDDGFLLDKKPGVHQPKRVENARILIANTPMDADKVKIFGSRITLDSVAKLGEMEAVENEKMKAKVDAFLKHNINVFINRQLIYNYPEQLFADAGVMAIEYADFDGVERIAQVTGGEIVSDIERCETVKLGHCDLIEEVMIGEDHLLKFSGLPVGESCTIVLRGATEQILSEAELALHDVLCVLVTTISERFIVPGGDCIEMVMARAVFELAAQTSGKESLAMEAYARALLQQNRKESKDALKNIIHLQESQERKVFQKDETFNISEDVAADVEYVTNTLYSSLELSGSDEKGAVKSENQLDLDVSLRGYESGPSRSEQHIFRSPSSSITSESSLPYSSPTESSTGSTSSNLQNDSYTGYQLDKNVISSGSSDDFYKRSNDGLWLGKTYYCPYTPKKKARYEVSPSPNPFQRIHFAKEESVDIEIESDESEEDLTEDETDSEFEVEETKK